MLKQMLLCAAVIAISAAASASGDPQISESATLAPPVVPTQTVSLPGTSFHIIAGVMAVQPGSTEIDAELVVAIVGWLSSNYDLPPIYDPPAIKFVPAEMMAVLRHRDIPSDVWSHAQADVGHLQASRESSAIVAIYDDVDRAIYLPERWTGNTPVELSVLVHEMVHHLQNVGGLTFACPEAREKMAYAAQQDWLLLFGRDIFTEFETDPFTLLVRTECLY